MHSGRYHLTLTLTLTITKLDGNDDVNLAAHQNKEIEMLRSKSWYPKDSVKVNVKVNVENNEWNEKFS